MRSNHTLALSRSAFALLCLGCATQMPSADRDAASIERDASGRDANVDDAGSAPDADDDPGRDAQAADASAVDAGAPCDPTGVPCDETAELAFVATYLGGISVYGIDSATGALSLVPGSPFDDGGHFYGIAVDPMSRFAYAIDVDAGDVIAYEVGANGALTRLSAPPSHVGGSPSAITMGPDGRHLYVALAGTSAMAVLAIDPVDGTLTPTTGSPFELPTAPAFVAIEPRGRFAYVSYAFAGIGAFALDAESGAPVALAGSPFAAASVLGGAIVIDPDSAVLLNARNGLNGLSIEEGGALSALPASPFTLDVSGDPSATGIALDPSGRFAYALDMAHGHVSAFAVDVASGTLTPVPGSPFDAIAPYSVAVDPTGRFVYVAGDAGSIAAFTRAANGALSPIPGGPFAVDGLQPEIVVTRAPGAT